jgi:hypothetical protein
VKTSVYYTPELVNSYFHLCRCGILQLKLFIWVVDVSDSDSPLLLIFLYSACVACDTCFVQPFFCIINIVIKL